MKQIGLAISCFLMFATVQAASFDCTKTETTRVEKIICANAELSRLDDDLNVAYKAALQEKEQAGALKRAQARWLAGLKDCQNADCLQMAYRTRIDELSQNLSDDRFVTILSKDKELCSAYKRYIEQKVETADQNTHDASPRCQRNFGEAFREFVSVKWREIKLQDHLELAVQAYRYIKFWPWSNPDMAPLLSDKQFKNQLDAVTLSYSNNSWRMWLGEADIGNNGHPETLLRVE